jgi:hypothetical protein
LTQAENSRSWRNKASKFSGLLKVLLIFIIAFGVFKLYSLWQYHTAPASLKEMRAEKIMQYESNDLERVYDYEGNSGKDFKGVVHGASKEIRLKSKSKRSFSDIKEEVTQIVLNTGWSYDNAYSTELNKSMDTILYNKKINQKTYLLSLQPGNDDNSIIIHILEQ